MSTGKISHKYTRHNRYAYKKNDTTLVQLFCQDYYFWLFETVQMCANYLYYIGILDK